jgi:hypothetical protein
MFNRSRTGLSVITSLDIWEGVCSVFLLAALIETLIISHLLATDETPTIEKGVYADRENEVGKKFHAKPKWKRNAC